MAKLLTGYQDMVGLLNIHKVARLNTQVIYSCFMLIYFYMVLLFWFTPLMHMNQ